ncbi:hypothetical protein [Halostagnicola sp. A-GB9-2]|uniref:hypothetical protein n=1 Tax=Halostagnicola sp. A-GB9-2 TaxID=3048066 RepID=UPI0024C0DC28|nr:hypothetical protein [Halostagnicola sp. A-GB9-2]MDJ1433580.1 hypothetical protein [Halostagnicola sp. A-GB9-2]
MTLSPPGRTAGGPAPMTAGGPRSGVAGSPDPFEGELVSEPEPLYELRLERNDGETRPVAGIESVDIVREHTDLSDWQVTVPEDDTLPEWRFADAELRHRGETLFTGQLQRVDPSILSAETVLEGFGPGSDLRLGHVRIERQNVNLYQVIEEVWREHTPFDAIVLRPEEPQQFSSVTVSGSPKSVLKDLHERAGMRFYLPMGDGEIDAVSFRPGRITRPSGWTRLDIDPTYDVGDYRNAVVVEGARSEELGRRYRGEAVDEDEIDRVGERLEEPIGPLPELESDEDCQRIADRRLEERVAEDQQEGSVDILPRLMPPGVRVPVPYYGGDERDIDQVSYTESLGDAEATITFDKEYSVAERVEEVDSELDSTKEMIR